MEIPHQHDKEFYEAMLDKLPATTRDKARMSYSEVFWSAYNNEPLQHKKLNKGRREANTKLRLFVDKYSAALMGYTSSPEKI